MGSIRPNNLPGPAHVTLEQSHIFQRIKNTRLHLERERRSGAAFHMFVLFGVARVHFHKTRFDNPRATRWPAAKIFKYFPCPPTSIHQKRPNKQAPRSPASHTQMEDAMLATASLDAGLATTARLTATRKCHIDEWTRWPRNVDLLSRHAQRASNVELCGSPRPSAYKFEALSGSVPHMTQSDELVDANQIVWPRSL